MIPAIRGSRPILQASAPAVVAPPRKPVAQPYSPPPGTVVCGAQPEKTAGAVVLGLVFFLPELAALLISLPFALIGGLFGKNFLSGFTETWRWIQRNIFFLIHTPMQHALTTIGQSFVVSPFMLKRLPNGDREFTVRIFLDGSQAPRRFAKEIGEHLSIPGNTVHVEFVDKPDAYTMTIPTHEGGVSYALSWRADDDAKTFAHELMHRLGVLDEYNHGAHFTNPNAPASFKFTRIFERLYQDDLPADRLNGIMANHDRKPLPRHFDEIVRKYAP